ncbi:MAG: TlpA disulfide reductase family protein [Lautropia sp.]|nr:TlpA disulfide reductase family protein [Lautropia sp.]
MQSIQIGPFSMSLSILLLLATILVASYVARWRAQGSDLDVEALFFSRLVLPSLLFARLAYVLQYHAAYLDDPISIIDIRDGGFNPWAGLAFAWLSALWQAWRKPPARQPLLAAMSCATVIAAAGLAWLNPARQSEPLPNLHFSTLSGEPVELKQFAGKPLVINLWATWCPHCVREMPVLSAAQRRYPQVTFIFVNQGEDATTIERFVGRQQLQADNLLMDTGSEAARSFAQPAMPTTLFYSKSGQLLDIRIGALSQATLQQRINRLLSDT